MRPVRLLHTSDVHLGGGFLAPDVGEHHDQCLCPLGAIESSVAASKPDAVLVAGDLFDNQRVSDSFVQRVLARLGSLGVPCVVINGNHDVHDDGTLFRTGTVQRSGVVFLESPEGTSVELFDGGLTLWGKAMPLHHRGFRPLQDVPPRPSDDGWWVVLGHGHFETDDQGAMGRSSPLTAEEIEMTGADYVALGHWHVRADVSTDSVPAWYSGAPYGLAASERFNLIELDPDAGVTVRPIPVRLAAEGCAHLT